MASYGGSITTALMLRAVGDVALTHCVAALDNRRVALLARFESARMQFALTACRGQRTPSSRTTAAAGFEVVEVPNGTAKGHSRNASVTMQPVQELVKMRSRVYFA